MFGRLPVSVLTLMSVLALVGGTSRETAAAQAGDAKTPSGVYTGAQAERGKVRFLTSCGNCHGVDLKGAAERAPALAGDPFMKNWETRNLNSLFTKIKTDMPRNQPGSLRDDIYLDIVAFILQANAFPEGTTELKAAVLDGVQILKTGSTAQKAVPNFALVETVGCLVEGPSNGWTLTNASEPLTSKDQPPTPQELKDAGSRPLGSDSYLLVSVIPFKPGAYKGNKIEAKGLLYRMPNENRLDVTSLEMIASSCPN